MDALIFTGAIVPLLLCATGKLSKFGTRIAVLLSAACWVALFYISWSSAWSN